MTKTTTEAKPAASVGAAAAGFPDVFAAAQESVRQAQALWSEAGDRLNGEFATLQRNTSAQAEAAVDSASRLIAAHWAWQREQNERAVGQALAFWRAAFARASVSA